MPRPRFIQGSPEQVREEHYRTIAAKFGGGTATKEEAIEAAAYFRATGRTPIATALRKQAHLTDQGRQAPKTASSGGTGQDDG